MPFEKGNTEGSKRGPGAKNKQWAELSDYMINDGAEKIMKYLGTLEGEALFNAYERLLNYFKPKHAATTVQAEIRLPELQIMLNDPKALEAIRDLTRVPGDVQDAEIIEPKQIKSKDNGTDGTIHS